MKDFDRRLLSLESRQPSSVSEGRQILSKCTDDELDRLGEIAIRSEDGKELTGEESVFLKALEAKYGPL
jgi:hypothetical protein